jgi:hypothetical protein
LISHELVYGQPDGGASFGDAEGVAAELGAAAADGAGVGEAVASGVSVGFVMPVGCGE